MKYTLKAGCILFNKKDKTIGLVYREQYKDYSFPKGHLEEGETLEECAIRETAEETKREAKILKKEPIYVEHYKTPKDEDVEMTYYLAEDIGPSDNKSLDTHPTVWIPFEEVYDKLTYPSLKKLWNEVKDKILDYFDESYNYNEIKYVVDNSKYVKINHHKLNNFIKELGNIKYTHWSKELKLNLNEKEWILLSFIIESMNFCFWKKPKWKFTSNNKSYTGSNAEFQAVINQVETNKNFLDINYLKKVTKEEFDKFFIGEGELPHLEKRYENFKEVIDYFNNHNVYEELYKIKSDIELLEYITTNFSSFDDKSIYKEKIIHFNKRATLLTNDLFYVSKTINKNIKNVNHLSGCADYAIPRAFRDFGILEYNKELSNLVDQEIEIKHDSEEEIEIRANMLYVIEIIKEKLKEKNIMINSVELDNLIWWMSKKIDRKTNSHHTITIYY